MKRVVRSTLLATSALTLVALAGACTRETAYVEITLDAHDYSFSMPDSVAGGLVHVRFANSGTEDHHAQFIRLNDGVTDEQFDITLQTTLQSLATEGDVAFTRLFEVASAAGGPSVIGASRTMDLVMDLQPGRYVLICFIPSPDGIPHVAKGMTRKVTVTAPSSSQPSPPVAAGTVDMADFAFATMPPITAGKTMIEVRNSGREPHEMVIVRLKGLSASQLLQMLSAPHPPPAAGAGPPPGPPPFEFVGGVQAIMPGQRAWTTLDLTPGEYALICNIPSPAHQGRPHTALGMLRAFTVS